MAKKLPPSRKSQSKKGVEDLWIQILQRYVALFFVASVIHKIYAFFLVGDEPISKHFHHWIAMDWPPYWWRHVMIWSLNYEPLVASTVIAFHTGAALLLLLNRATRLGGVLLFIMQFLIYLSSFGIGLNEFVGISMWLALYFVFKPKKAEEYHKGLWVLMTILLIYHLFLHLYFRYIVSGDPWLNAFEWQRENYQKDIMSVIPALKQLVLWISNTTIGPYLWVSVWWLKLFLTLLLFTRIRLYAGALLCIQAFLRVLIWTNGATAVAVLWLIDLLLWTTQEHLLNQKQRLPSLLYLFLMGIRSFFFPLFHPQKTITVLKKLLLRFCP